MTVPASPSFSVYNVRGYTEGLGCTSGELTLSSGSLAVADESLSFVRSVSMDTWQEEQIKRMQVRERTTFERPIRRD